MDVDAELEAMMAQMGSKKSGGGDDYERQLAELELEVETGKKQSSSKGKANVKMTEEERMMAELEAEVGDGGDIDEKDLKELEAFDDKEEGVDGDEAGKSAKAKKSSSKKSSETKKKKKTKGNGFDGEDMEMDFEMNFDVDDDMGDLDMELDEFGAEGLPPKSANKPKPVKAKPAKLSAEQKAEYKKVLRWIDDSRQILTEYKNKATEINDKVSINYLNEAEKKINETISFINERETKNLPLGEYIILEVPAVVVTDDLTLEDGEISIKVTNINVIDSASALDTSKEKMIKMSIEPVENTREITKKDLSNSTAIWKQPKLLQPYLTSYLLIEDKDKLAKTRKTRKLVIELKEKRGLKMVSLGVINIIIDKLISESKKIILQDEVLSPTDGTRDKVYKADIELSIKEVIMGETKEGETREEEKKRRREERRSKREAESSKSPTSAKSSSSFTAKGKEKTIDLKQFDRRAIKFNVPIFDESVKPQPNTTSTPKQALPITVPHVTYNLPLLATAQQIQTCNCFSLLKEADKEFRAITSITKKSGNKALHRHYTNLSQEVKKQLEKVENLKDSGKPNVAKQIALSLLQNINDLEASKNNMEKQSVTLGDSMKRRYDLLNMELESTLRSLKLNREELAAEGKRIQEERQKAAEELKKKQEEELAKRRAEQEEKKKQMLASLTTLVPLPLPETIYSIDLLETIIQEAPSIPLFTKDLDKYIVQKERIEHEVEDEKLSVEEYLALMLLNIKRDERILKKCEVYKTKTGDSKISADNGYKLTVFRLGIMKKEFEETAEGEELSREDVEKFINSNWKRLRSVVRDVILSIERQPSTEGEANTGKTFVVPIPDPKAIWSVDLLSLMIKEAPTIAAFKELLPQLVKQKETIENAVENEDLSVNQYLGLMKCCIDRQDDVMERAKLRGLPNNDVSMGFGMLMMNTMEKELDETAEGEEITADDVKREANKVRSKFTPLKLNLVEWIEEELEPVEKPKPQVVQQPKTAPPKEELKKPMNEVAPQPVQAQTQQQQQTKKEEVVAQKEIKVAVPEAQQENKAQVAPKPTQPPTTNTNNTNQATKETVKPPTETKPVQPQQATKPLPSPTPTPAQQNSAPPAKQQPPKAPTKPSMVVTLPDPLSLWSVGELGRRLDIMRANKAPTAAQQEQTKGVEKRLNDIRAYMASPKFDALSYCAKLYGTFVNYTGVVKRCEVAGKSDLSVTLIAECSAIVKEELKQCCARNKVRLDAVTAKYSQGQPIPAPVINI